MKPKQVF